MANDRAAMVIRIGANLESLKRDLAAAGTLVSSTTNSLKKMADSLQGAPLINQATKLVAVIKEIGVASLSTANAAKSLNTITSAMDQMYRLGKPVPLEFFKIRDALKAVGDQAAAAAPKVQQASVSLTSVWSTFKSILGGLGIGIGIGTIGTFIRSTFAAADSVGTLATKMGVSVVAAQRFQYAAQQSSADIEDVSRAIVAMNNNLAQGDKSAINALKAAGLSFETIRAMKPEQAFRAIADAIGGMADPMTQTRVALELFGKAGAELLPMIRDGSLQAADAVNVMSEKTVKRLKDAQQWWQNLWNTIVIGSAEALGSIGDGSMRSRFQGYAGDSGTERISDEEAKKIIGDAAGEALKTLTSRFKELPPAIKDVEKALKETEPITAELTSRVEKHEEAVRELEKRYQAYKEQLLTGVTPAQREQWAWETRITKETGLSIDQLKWKTTAFEHLIRTMKVYGREVVDNVPKAEDEFLRAFKAFGDGSAFGLNWKRDVGGVVGQGLGAIPTDSTRIQHYVDLIGMAANAMGQLGTMGGRTWRTIAQGGQQAIQIMQQYVAAGRTAAATAQAATAAATMGFGLIATAMIEGWQATLAYRARVVELRQELERLGYAAEEVDQQLREALRGGEHSGRGGFSDPASGLDTLLERARTQADLVTDAVNRLSRELDHFGGRAPSSLQPAIAALLAMSNLPAEARRQLQAMQGGPQWQFLEDSANQFGIDRGALGAGFNTERLAGMSGGFDQIDSFLREALDPRRGGDRGRILEGVSDELRALLTAAQSTGASLPTYIRQTLEEMAQRGLLEGFDLNSFSWTDALKSAAERTNDYLLEIRNLLAMGLNPAGTPSPGFGTLPVDQFLTPRGGGGQHIHNASGVQANVTVQVYALDSRDVEEWARTGDNGKVLAMAAIRNQPAAYAQLGIAVT